MKKYLLCISVLLLFLFSNVASAQVVAQPANQNPIPGQLGVGQNTGTFDFTWTLNYTGGLVNPDGYLLEISTSSSFTGIDDIYDVFSTSGTDRNENLGSLTPGHLYYWRITAYVNSPYNQKVSSATSFYTGNPLPVELTSFSGFAINNIVTLKWSTATEVNNYGFDVERSVDNKTWTKIGFVAGAGNSNSPKNYSFKDEPNGGASFSYRLKQIDVGGAYKYYDPITVSLSGGDKAQLMQNSPNPFNPSTAIKYYIPQAVDVTISIYDILGREVTKLVNSQVEAGYHVVYWNGRDRFGNAAASSVYIYRLTAGSFTEIKKMNLLK
jgi:hypothetical protein